MDEPTMSPAERQFRDLMDSTQDFFLRVGQAYGWVEGGRRLLYLQGTRRFGQPDDDALDALDDVRFPDYVEALALRIVDQDVRTWDDLFRAFRPGEGESHAGADEPDAPASKSMVGP
jgi:hypothetical protein